VYPSEPVATLIRDHFIPVRAHISTEGEVFQRFNAQWTPTVIIADDKGVEQHRIEGFLETPDFLPQLRLGLAHAARARGDWSEAEQIYRELAADDSLGDVAAEATYWAGVSRYKGTSDAAALGETASSLKERFPGSAWAKKSSIWAG
jgi:hypothetical protein